jgi:hypothetical protein
MKKLSIVLLAVFFIGITNVNAQTEVNDKKATVVYSEGDQEIIMVEKVKTCAKTGKVCDATCENKKNGTCCKGEKNKSCSKSEKVSCSKSKAKCSKSEKASCSKDEKKVSCSKSDKKKGCCKKEATAMSNK